MNKTSIEYMINPDGTPGFNWPILTGCLHPCSKLYCYNTMKSSSPLNRFFKKNRKKETGEMHFALPEEGTWPYGFDPTFYPYRLEEPMARKKPANIFVANGGDLFGAWVPDECINYVLTVIRDCPQHTFILLTKNFGRLYNFEFPDNAWVGFSTNHSGEIHMEKVKAKTKFVSFEPLHSGYDKDWRNCGYGQKDGYRRIGMYGVDWIVIGAETGPRAELFRPKRDWVMTLVKSAQEKRMQDKVIPVWMKNNLAPALFEKSELIQELPKEKAPEND